ncbi:MAG: YdcF family protein [Thermoflavifilum aggregans]|nr:YdcF family protein [Thermoflavifilum aggregans]
MKNRISAFRRNNRLCFLLIFFVSITSLASNAYAFEEGRKIDPGDSINEASVLSQRIFFLLYEIEHNEKARQQTIRYRALDSMGRKKIIKISEAVNNCADMNCLVKALEIDKGDDEVIKSSLSRLYSESRDIRDLIKNDIRPSHAFQLHASLSDSALFIEAWNEQRRGLNHILHAYLQNKGLSYPSIDSSRFDVNSAVYLNLVKHTIRASLKDRNSQLFFQPLLDICIKVLQLNGRNEAARSIPLTDVNHTAYDQIPHINWKDYPYSSILVFGEGPTEPDVPITPSNKERCREAVKVFKNHQAPFLIVSGGYVHPFETKYCEAEQMKKFMMDSLGVPAKAIIMEPHARHTTTNIRNTNRIIFNEKIPSDKPILGVTSESHIDYIVSDRFKKACRRDLGYIPFTGLKRLSAYSVAFYPIIESLQINASEPLDP